MNTTKPEQNIFEELGLPDAKELEVKSQLAIRLLRVMRERKLTQAQTAKITGLSQPRISDMIRGRWHGVSEMAFMECLNALGEDIEIVIHKHKAKQPYAPGRTAVTYA